MDCTFTIPGEPSPWRPARVTIHRRADGTSYRVAHKEKPETAYKDRVVLAARLAGIPYDDGGALAIEVVVVYARPRSWPKTKRLGREPKLTRPDGVNILKATEDALIGIAFRDDSQLWSERIERWWGAAGEAAHVTIRLWSNQDDWKVVGIAEK